MLNILNIDGPIELSPGEFVAYATEALELQDATASLETLLVDSVATQHVLDNISTMITHITKYGLSQESYELLNGRGELSKLLELPLPNYNQGNALALTNCCVEGLGTTL